MSGFTFGGVGTAKPKPSAKKSDRAEQEIQGIKALAALDAVIASLTAVQKDLEADVKEQTTEIFVTHGCATKLQPANFRGIEEGSSASCELRKRSVRSYLSDEEIRVADELGVGHRPEVVTVETFIINQDCLKDRKVMGTLEKLVAGAVAKGQLPTDIFLKQEGVSHTVVNDDALPALFRTATPETATRALALCGTLAVGKTKFDGSLLDAVALVQTLVGSPLFREKAEAAAADPSSTKRSKKAA